MSKRQAVTQPMIDAYVAWEPPCELDVSKPSRVIGLIRSAFMSGYKAGERATPKSSEGDPNYSQSGMSLRDYFAGHALPWALSLDYGNDWGKSGKGHAPFAAAMAYAVADAMLAHRAKAGADHA